MDKTKITLYEQKPGTDKSLSKTETIRENGTVTLPNPTDKYYNFQGWSKTPNGAVDFNANQEVMVTSENLIENKLYGIWKANRTITIHYNQPVGEKTEKKENYIDGNFILENPADITGYKFIGWSLDPNSSEIKYQPNETIYVTETNPLPKDLYAIWEKEEKVAVPTGVMDDIIPMALAVMISASIIAVIILSLIHI